MCMRTDWTLEDEALQTDLATCRREPFPRIGKLVAFGAAIVAVLVATEFFWSAK